MGVEGESDVDPKIQLFRDYLEYTEQVSSVTHKMNQENEIIESIFSALKSRKKYYVQIIKSFDISELNSALLYIYSKLRSNGIEIQPLENLAFNGIHISKGEKVVYLISENHLDTSNSATMHILSDLIDGMVPKEAEGTPILLGLTDETLRKLRKVRGNTFSDESSKLSLRQQGRNVTPGAGLILLSLTFLVTAIGTIFDRPHVFFLPDFTASWIIFSLSVIGILGFVLVFFGSMTLKTGRTRLVAIAFLMIASFELLSVYIQLSNLSIIKGGGFVMVTPLSTTLVESNARIIPELYALLAAFLSIACYILIHSFSGHKIKVVALAAVACGIIVEALTAINFARIPLFEKPLMASYYSNSLFISFYNNISPILPYPGVILNITDLFTFFGKYSSLIFYMILGLGFTANFLFFVTFAVTGFHRVKSKEVDLPVNPMSLN